MKIKKQTSVQKRLRTMGALLMLPALALGGLAVLRSDPSTSAVTGDSIILDGDIMQYVNIENCPTEQTFVRDARDNRTYWIQKISGTGAGGTDLCWMKTNLAYEGGGDNFFGDVKSLVEYGDEFSMGNTEARWVASDWVDSDDLYTTGMTAPNPSGNYGYLYNWCAAMGGQSSACNMTEDNPDNIDADVSICPAGWRLPTGETGTGEFTLLNNIVNDGHTLGAGAGNGLTANWLSTVDEYWSSTINSATDAHNLIVSWSHVSPASNSLKDYGMAVRCVNDTPADTNGSGPSVISLTFDPNQGPVSGGTVVTISGDDLVQFSAITSVKFGDVDGTDIERVDNTTMKVATPAHAPGAVNVVMVVGEGQEYIFNNAFTFVPGVPNTAGSVSHTMAIVAVSSTVLALALFAISSKQKAFVKARK